MLLSRSDQSFVSFFPRLVEALFVSAPSRLLSPLLLDPRAAAASVLSLQFLLLPESLSAAMTYHLFAASRLGPSRNPLTAGGLSLCHVIRLIFVR